MCPLRAAPETCSGIMLVQPGAVRIGHIPPNATIKRCVWKTRLVNRGEERRLGSAQKHGRTGDRGGIGRGYTGQLRFQKMPDGGDRRDRDHGASGGHDDGFAQNEPECRAPGGAECKCNADCDFAGALRVTAKDITP
jgi:hypothetical protein